MLLRPRGGTHEEGYIAAVDGPAGVDLATMAALIGGASGRGVQPAEAAVLSRLIRIAQGDTGQSRRIADFLLAWWNAGSCGGFDLTTLWGLDSDIAADMTGSPA